MGDARISAWVAALLVTGVSSAALAADGEASGGAEQRCRAAAPPGERPALLRWSLGTDCAFFDVPITLRGAAENFGAVPVDRYGNEYRSELTLSPVVRLGARLSSGFDWRPVQVRAEYEQDVVTGSHNSHADDLEGEGYPGGEGLSIEPRKALVRSSLGRALHLSTGLDTSHWGLGLVANDGDHDWEPGSAEFVFPQGGDRVFRWSAATGPHTDLGLFAEIGGDRVYRDDVLLPGDRARQFFAAVLAGVGKPHSFGVYVVRRNQQDSALRDTNVWVVDATGKTSFELSPGKLSFEAESAFITGQTEMGPSNDFPQHDLRQLGAAFRAHFDAGQVGGVLDVLYASGDQNPYDDQENAFKADPNYELGLILFRHVLAAQTARGAGTAGDLTLVGVRPANWERIPTRGSITNTLAFFPRVWVRPVSGLEGYAGPLFAFAPVHNIDQFNTRLAGGQARNALDGRPGGYLGTELDAGLRYRIELDRAELTLGAEGGVLLAGSALDDATGSRMKSVHAARALVRLGL